MWKNKIIFFYFFIKKFMIVGKELTSLTSFLGGGFWGGSRAGLGGTPAWPKMRSRLKIFPPTIHKIKSGVENHELKIRGWKSPVENHRRKFGAGWKSLAPKSGEEIRVMIFNLPEIRGRLKNHELKIIGGNPCNDFQLYPKSGAGWKSRIENHRWLYIKYNSKGGGTELF